MIARVLPSRRGFALPMVILLAMVVGIMSTVMLERETTQRLSADRMIASYREHHTARGAREVVGAWLVSLAGQPLERMIAPDGRVLDIRRPGGSVVRVYMVDGQGSVLTDLTGVAGEDLALARAVRDRLAETSRGRPESQWVRRVGPLKISAGGAPEPVLEAAAFAVRGAREAARAFAREVIEARRDGELTAAELGLAADRAGLNAEERARLDRIMIPKPDLWLVRVEVWSQERAGTRERLVGKYQGRVPLGSSAVGGLGSGMMQSLGTFLSWEELPLE